jgi:exopolysaccharide biosynthesis polyprenyl glycosylphosphotransferase
MVLPTEHLGVTRRTDWSGLLRDADSRTLEILQLRRAAARRRGWLVARMLLLADVVGLGLAYLIALLAFGGASSQPGAMSVGSEALLFLATLPLWAVAAKVYGLYDNDDERTDYSTADDVIGVFHLVTVGSWVLFIATSALGLLEAEVGRLVLFWALAIALVTVSRSCARAFCRRQIHYLQNTLIVGAGDVGQFVARKLVSHPEYGVNLVGFVDADPRQLSDDLARIRVLGPPEDLPLLVRLLDVERVILAFSRERETAMLEVAEAVKVLDVQVDIVPRLYETVGPNATIYTVEGMSLLGLPPTAPSRSSLAVKRAIDVVMSAAGLVFLTPVLAAIAVAIKLDSRGPVFYRNERVGRNGTTFRLLKFRSMALEHCRGPDYGGETAEAQFARLMADPERQREFETSFKLQEDPRVTRVGRFLRRTSLDELPQLINVLRGEMSLVGPRPIPVDDLEAVERRAAGGVSRLSHKAPTLLAVKPGITGYWQINGRSSLDYADRVRLDAAYVTSWSLRLDCQILAKTVRVLLSRNGAA